MKLIRTKIIKITILIIKIKNKYLIEKIITNFVVKMYNNKISLYQINIYH